MEETIEPKFKIGDSVIFTEEEKNKPEPMKTKVIGYWSSFADENTIRISDDGDFYISSTFDEVSYPYVLDYNERLASARDLELCNV